MDHSTDFFKHISREVDALRKVYVNVAAEIDSAKKKGIKITATLTYAYLTGQINRAIDSFKTEMQACLQDYCFLKDNDMLAQYFTTGIKDKLDKLHSAHNEVKAKIPNKVLKADLKSNYYFHKNIRKLTVKSLLDYFETNYILRKKQDN